MAAQFESAYPSRQRGTFATHTVTKPMTDTPPDRLAANPKSLFHDAAVFARGVGIRFNGEERTNVEEYCVSEGWVRLPVGKSRDRHGNPMTLKIKGEVVPYFVDSRDIS